MIIKLASFQELEDQVDTFFVHEHIIEVYNIRMLNMFHDMDLFLQTDCFFFVHFLPT